MQTNNFLPLDRVMSEGRKNNHIFAIHRDGDNVYWSEFSKDVSRAAWQLKNSKTEHYVMACESIYFFIVGLMAILHAGKHAVISPNLQKEKLSFIAQKCNGEIIRNEQVSRFIKDDGGIVEFHGINSAQLSFTIYTSGSTGVSTPITKPIEALEAEISTLHKLWGECILESLFVSSVIHYHAYGLLFQLLWPLCEGIPILLERISYPEALIRYSNDYKLNFISSPSFLQNYAEIICLGSTPHSLNLVISSGAALPFKTAKVISSLITKPIIEIYGTTETGIIATRSCLNGEEWSCMQHVAMQHNGQGFLQVKSPYTGKTRWQVVADSVVFLSGNRFILNGRNDRVVKIYEKRISLTELEKTCQKLPWVNAAKAIMLNNSERLGCVIELNHEGVNFLANNTKSTLVEIVKKHLHSSFDLILLPRKWRFVEKFPYDKMSKLTHEELLKLF